MNCQNFRLKLKNATLHWQYQSKNDWKYLGHHAACNIHFSLYHQYTPLSPSSLEVLRARMYCVPTLYIRSFRIITSRRRINSDGFLSCPIREYASLIIGRAYTSKLCIYNMHVYTRVQYRDVVAKLFKPLSWISMRLLYLVVIYLYMYL